MVTSKQKNRGSGWVKIGTPEDLRSVLQKMLNKILMSKQPLEHAGTFAQLANAWTRVYQTELTLIEVKQLEQRIGELEDLKRYNASRRNEAMSEAQRSKRELQELMKKWQ